MGWFAYIPFFLLTERISVKKSFLFGAIYGILSYFALCFWISNFGPVAISFVCLLFGFYNSLLFFILAFVKNNQPHRFEKYFWIFRVLLVLAFEFLRTHGILAFSYGIIGYSQWKNPVFLRFASLFGVFGVSFLILLFDSIVAKILSERNFRGNLRKISIFISLLLGIFVFFGISILFPQKKKFESLKVALIQNASSAPSNSISDFEKDASLLMNLSDKALLSNPDTELVVWAETAVVPSIIRNLKENSEPRRHNIAKKLVRYFKDSKKPFLIGNFHDDDGGAYNSALYFSPDSERIGIYNKNHLVPFTEFWPSILNFRFFDGIQKSLACDFFDSGKEANVFLIKDLFFATPICFEDSFSPLIRKMKRNGADFFVSINDDAWTKSKAAQKMHLSMSAFRCAEFNSPMIRATIDGVTCILDSSGKIVSEIESGTDDFLVGTVEIPKSSSSFYNIIGDSPMWILTILVFFYIILILFSRFGKFKAYGRR